MSGSVRLFPASIGQALPASLQTTTAHTTVRLCQAPSSLTLDHSPSFLRHHSCHSPSSLSLAISLSTFSCLCNSCTLQHTLPIVLIVPHRHPPSHSHSKAHSCLLTLILLTHLSYSCSPFLTCSHTLILAAYLAFSLHSTLSFATLTVRCILPSTLSSHSPSTHLPLSRHPVRVMLYMTLMYLLTFIDI